MIPMTYVEYGIASVLGGRDARNGQTNLLQCLPLSLHA